MILGFKWMIVLVAFLGCVTFSMRFGIDAPCKAQPDIEDGTTEPDVVCQGFCELGRRLNYGRTSRRGWADRLICVVPICVTVSRLALISHAALEIEW
jgi:hypothetical protein